MVVHVLCDGETEVEFVRRVLTPHFEGRIRLKPRLRNEPFVGPGGSSATSAVGQASWGNYRNAIRSLLRAHRGPREHVTTMIDLFRLSSDFPVASAALYGGEKAREIQRLCESEIGDTRFRCYIQCHEFEALLLAEVSAIQSSAPEPLRNAKGWSDLANAAAASGPEQVNEDNGPSKRIIAAWPGYAKQKNIAGPAAAASIGLPRLRGACPHFAEWVAWMEGLAS